MAAAMRIKTEVKKSTETDWTTTELQPFETWTLNTTNKTMTNTTSANKNSNGKYTYALGSSVAVDSVYYVTMTIWVEGTDNECDNITTGTKMQVKINFVYADTGQTITDWGFANTATGAATVVKAFA